MNLSISFNFLRQCFGDWSAYPSPGKTLIELGLIIKANSYPKALFKIEEYTILDFTETAYLLGQW
jgi:hypothetical protein